MSFNSCVNSNEMGQPTILYNVVVFIFFLASRFSLFLRGCIWGFVLHAWFTQHIDFMSPEPLKHWHSLLLLAVTVLCFSFIIFFLLIPLQSPDLLLTCEVRRSHHLFWLSAPGGHGCEWSIAANTNSFAFTALAWANWGWVNEMITVALRRIILVAIVCFSRTRQVWEILEKLNSR